MIGRDDILSWERGHLAAVTRKDKFFFLRKVMIYSRTQIIIDYFPRELTQKCGKEGESI